jgi:hypothetical protein
MGARSVVAVIVLGLLAVAAATPTAGAGDPDAAARRHQKAVLDPQASDGKKPITPSGSQEVLHHHDVGAGTSGTSSPVDATVGGEWGYRPPLPVEFNAIHAVMGPGGKVLLVAGSGGNTDNFAAGTFTSYVWDPVTNEHRQVHTPEDLFCAGHVLLPDGRALVAGGTVAYHPFKGAKALYVFDFETESYEQLTPLEVGRWYPTAVTGPDGRVLLVSGLDETGITTDVIEEFDYRSNTHSRLPVARKFPLYPHLLLAGSGRWFFAGPGSSNAGSVRPGLWNPATNQYRIVSGLPVARQRNGAATCFVGDVRNQNVIVLGGGWPATNTTAIVKLNASTPTYRQGPALKAAKAYLGCVNLPDGSLFEANGGSSNAISAASPEAALLRSVRSEWTPVNPLPAGEHRLYHSMLFLLDDGHVVSMTSNPKTDPRSSTILAWAPPYLFKGPRPTITESPTEVTYGGSYAVAATAAGATVGRFTLTSAPSVTHALDANQRYVSLPVVDGRITIPSSRSILPPGWYRLWAVDGRGRPSTATWLKLS